MPRACLTARVAALAAVCAVGAPVAIATASAAADMQATTVSGPTVRTPASERATVRAGGPAAVAATSTAQGFLGISHLAEHDHRPVGLRRRSGHSLRPPGEKPLPRRTVRAAPGRCRNR